MKLEWRTSDAVEWWFHVPAKLIFFFGERSIELNRQEAYKIWEFIQAELGHQDALFSFKMQSDNLDLSFIILVNPIRKIIYIPPGSLVTNRSYPWAGSKMQQVFEEISKKNGYRLMVCISANDVWIFNQRVQDILLSQSWYHLAPPPTTRKPYAKQFGIHRSTYKDEGIAELWVTHEEMLLAQHRTH